MKPRIPLPRSLRSQLTVWNGIVLALVLAGFTFAVYSLLANSLVREIDRSLADRALQVNASMPPPPPPSVYPREGQSPPPSQRFTIPRPVTFVSADTFVQVVTLEGDIIATSDTLGEVRLHFTGEDLAAVRAGVGRYALAEVEGERVRVYTAPFLTRGEPAGAIQVARSFELVDHTLGQLRLLAGLGVLVALVLSGVVVRITTGVALRPVERVIETAEAIGSSGDLGRRVPPLASSDEVGRLATTFNRMLDRLEASAMALKEAFGRVESALDAQRRFVADASHELRTPLTTIRSNAGLLNQFPEVTAEDRQAALLQIDQETARMSRLVHELLTLARADSGHELPRERVELTLLVEDVVSQARLLSRGRHRIEWEIGPGAEVEGNPDALRQLALLLLDNAVKYSPAGGRISVRLGDDDGRVRLDVADTGIGIAPEELPHIFERFYRADVSRQAGGAGLGLSIARWIAEQHGASIEVASTPGQGSTFTVLLPRASYGEPAAEA
jgi:two-component system, OmpR family, sensor kinase